MLLTFPAALIRKAWASWFQVGFLTMLRELIAHYIGNRLTMPLKKPDIRFRAVSGGSPRLPTASETLDSVSPGHRRS